MSLWLEDVLLTREYLLRGSLSVKTFTAIESMVIQRIFLSLILSVARERARSTTHESLPEVFRNCSKR